MTNRHIFLYSTSNLSPPPDPLSLPFAGDSATDDDDTTTQRRLRTTEGFFLQTSVQIMSYYNSPNDDHIRQLLNQRHASSSTYHHSRFPSISDVPDSPSVYSRSPFTPRPFDKVEQSTPIPTFDDLDQEPSTLDLSDDPRASFATARTTYRPEGAFSSGEDLSTTEEDEPEHRISMLGIKMRFHSKAPWEAGGEDTPEGEHERNSVERPPSRSKRSIKSFALRPSVESSRSNKKSLDVSQYSIGGALQCVYRQMICAHQQVEQFGCYSSLAQVSMTSTSLLPPQSTVTQTSVRQKLSLPKIRSRAGSNSTTSSSSPHSTMCSPFSKGPSSPLPERWSAHTDTTPMFSDRSPSPVSHPYANPELSRIRTGDSVYPRSFVSFDTQSEESFPRTTSVTTLTSSPTTSNSLVTPPHQAASSKVKSRARDRDISGPMPLSSHVTPDPRLRENADIIPGWQGQTQTAFSLISLEEARAQRRLTQLDSSTGLCFTPPQPEYSTPPQPRPLNRSLGSGGKAKGVFQSVVTDFNRPAKQRSDPPETPDSVVAQGVKPLKHKKSGFMRMFSKEKAPTTPPLDIPSFSLEESKSVPPVPRTPRLPVHRIPVPPVSSAVNTTANPLTDSPTSLDGTTDDHSSNSGPSPKRIIPPLCINTNSPGINRSFSQTHQASNSLGTNPLQPPKPTFASLADNGGSKPQSAPPGKTDFVALSLRPVSTGFSSHFADHLLRMEKKMLFEPALDVDSGTPTTATESGGISPLSPDFVSLRDPTTATSAKSSSDDSQQDVIRALQGQIFGAKEDWQRHIWGLEGQIRDLKAEIEEMRQAEDYGRYCDVCGRGRAESGSVRRHRTHGVPSGGVGHRPRAYTVVNSQR